MSDMPIYPVILCGGDGTRLWPASRKAMPKQFMQLHGSTLFQETVKRVLDNPSMKQPVIVCNQDHRFIVASQMQELESESVSKPDIILEPEGRNTAPAITLAALHLLDKDPLMLVLPSDHALKDLGKFNSAISCAAKAAEKGKLVTFGITPTEPATGYGYILKGKPLDNCSDSWLVESFVEKPDLETAKKFLTHGNYLWNSGMFLFRASVYIHEMSLYAPEILEACRIAYEKKTAETDFIRVSTEDFLSSPSLSIDYAVMEHSADACVVDLPASWSDLGSWSSLYDIEELDENFNACSGDVLAQDSTNCFFYAQHRLVTALGLTNTVVIETPDVIMVADKNRAEDVKLLVNQLKKQKRSEVHTHSKVFRPWGNYESLVVGDRFQVKRIIVMPGQQLSLQRHYHRAEHWVVVRGTVQVHLDGTETILQEDESTYIPLAGVHRLYNPGKVPAEIIEIQTGTYLGEDDIERFEDIYGR